MEPLESGTVRTIDSELYYEVYGSGRPLVLIHGGWMNRQVWQPQLEALAADHQVITYDLRGHGRSTMGDLPYSHVDDLERIMDKLKLETAVLIGHSMGGSVARAMAIEKPDRVEALVLVATGGWGIVGIPFSKEEGELLAQPREAALEGDYDRAADLYESIWIDGVDRQATAEVRSGLRAILDDYTYADLQPDAPEVMWSTHTLRDLHLMHFPVLLAWGINDQPISQRTAVMSADVLPDPATGSIENAAHYLNWDQPQEFNQLVLDFLAGQ